MDGDEALEEAQARIHIPRLALKAGVVRPS